MFMKAVVDIPTTACGLPDNALHLRDGGDLQLAAHCHHSYIQTNDKASKAIESCAGMSKVSGV